MPNNFIKGHKLGDNITIMNTWYKRFQDGSGKRQTVAGIVYKDLQTGLKYRQEMLNPNYTYYIADEHHRVNYNRVFIPEEHTVAVTVPYESIEKDIAERIGLKDYFYDNVKSGNRYENKRLHMHPDIFNSDSDIQDNIRFEFGRAYKNAPCSITKAFFDIEVDAINAAGDFPEPGECPIDLISIIFQDRMECYTLILRTPDNPLIAEFEQEVKDGIIYQEAYDFVCENVGGPERMAKFNLDDMTFKFMFYDADNEINLIADLFKLINAFKPDFVLAWNEAFDIPYMIARCRTLGYDPRDIMCHPDFKYKFADYYIDERNKNDFAERGDFCSISSYSCFIDQMIHFASRRKATKFPSYSLDMIGEISCGIHKADYKHITTNLLKLSRLDFKLYVFYNICDCIVSKCIEQKTNDLEYVHGKALMNNTRYQKVHRQTVYLANRGIKEFRKDGYIMGNNINRFSEKPTSKYPGAFVADPRQLNNYSAMKIANNCYIKCFSNLVDWDKYYCPLAS